MRILILGDSLSLPRPRNGQPLPTTWPILLKEQIPQVELWLRAHTRFTITDVLRELGFFTDSLTEFDALIVQSGIVDCAPRPYPQLVAKLLDAAVGMPTFRKIERFTHEHLLWCYRRAWVSPRAFACSIQNLVHIAHQHNPSLKVIFVPIAPPMRSIVRMLPGIDTAASRYNDILRTTAAKLSCVTIDPFSCADPSSITIEDGHHLSCLGHRLVACALTAVFSPSRVSSESNSVPTP